MKDFFALHALVLVDNPFTALLIIVWGAWYINYKLRAARKDADPTKKHEHKKRIVVASLTMLCGWLLLPSITSDLNAQQVRKEVTGNSDTQSEEGVPSNAPSAFGPDTVYDPQDEFLYELLGNMKSEPGGSQQIVDRLTGLKETMQNGPIGDGEMNKMEPQMAKDHKATMCMLNLMYEIPYASHGYDFQRPATKAFFRHFSWYTPRTADIHTIEADFNISERQSLKTIRDFESQHWTQ